ncbi:AAA family ATPase [Pseudoflavonifractor capillosus]|uniref:AAA family ATPase n=1 Tax=Pseudoflavonifractor capillosus TaxID=106588 RepID=A0A921SSX7_9FIRM|nr:AAA family ATPase [Pseudoflavonifractor capillosus]HJG87320.1 AAA family ATPase [Pseudoflavonifractor capillosus]
MRIIKMTATFGRLNHAVLEPGPGLNLIEAPNESGKSTWCAFLRSMLYGIPTRERDRQDYIAEKNRYQPWSGSAMEGALELEWKGERITIRRGPRGSTPFGAFSAVYSDTGEPVPGLTAANCGETILGVSRSVFEKSAFVGQGGAAISADAELERRIAALVSSGEEDVSYSQVESTLKEWLRRRKYNKSGQIPRLESELAVLDDTLARQEQAARQAEEARRDLEQLTAWRDSLKAALATWQSRENQERRRMWEEAAAALEKARAEVAALEAEQNRHGAPPDRETLRRAQEDLAYLKTVNANLKLAESQVQEAEDRARAAQAETADDLFPDMTADQAWQQASGHSARVTECRVQAARASRAGWAGAAISAVAGAALAAAGWFLLPQTGYILPIAGAAVLVIGAAVSLAVSRGRAGRLTAEAEELLGRYSAEYPDDIMARANAFREKWVAAQEARRSAEAVEDSRRRLTAQRDELTGALMDLVHTFEPAVRDFFGVSAAISRALNLEERLSTARVRLDGAEKLSASLPRPQAVEPEGDPDGALPEHFDPQEAAAALSSAEGELTRLRSLRAMAQGEMNTLGDPVLFQSRREELTEELSRRREEYAALTLALEGLDEANGQLRARFSPALNARAGELLARLTGGKYSRVTLTRELEASAEEADSPLPRRTLLLSQGTAEQVYLAVRLAVCRLALPAEDPAPLVLDDALDAFDDSRMALALEVLRELAEERQILLFTCHSREAACLRGAEDVKVLSLS